MAVLSTYRIYLGQSRRGSGSNGELPYLWQLCFRTSSTVKNTPPTGNVFGIVGSYAGWAVHTQIGVLYTMSGTWEGCCYVGEIPAAAMDAVIAILNGVPTKLNDPTWNSQYWCWDALQKLQRRGYSVVLEETFEEQQKKMIGQVKATYNAGNDTD